MPRSTTNEVRQKRLNNSLGSRNSLAWECPKCQSLISILHGGRSRHERACHAQSESSVKRRISARSAPLPMQRPLAQSFTSISPPPSQNPQGIWTPTISNPPHRRRRSVFRKVPLHPVQSPAEEAEQGTSQGSASPASGSSDELPVAEDIEWDDWSGVPDHMDEGEAWLRVHPFSCMRSKVIDSTQPQAGQLRVNIPPFYPFASIGDFEQASLLISQGATDPYITAQLKLNARRMGTENRRLPGAPQSADELHKLLESVALNEGINFNSHDIITPEIGGKRYKYRVHSRPLWDAARDIVKDPDLKEYMIYMPEQRFVRSTLSGKVVQVIEEPYHSRGWWDAQLRIGPDGCILYIMLYIDATHLTLSGGAKVWPVYLWLGNLPSSIRTRQGKGGAILVGYLPVVKEEKDLNSATLAELRVYVYHEALKFIIQSIENLCTHGKVVRCSDGTIRRLYPLIGSISADYEELMKILSLLGHQSAFPCPLCLVPRDDQGDLSGTCWEPRTYSGTLDVLDRASLAKKSTEAKAIRQEQSLRPTKSSLLMLMGSEYSVYKAVACVDPLHQIELGVFGRHMWPKLTSLLSRKQCATLDQRFMNIPRYPDLDHFNNSVTSLQHIEGNEYGTILRMLAPLIDDLLPVKHRNIILKTLRVLACIHVLSKLTAHTEETLTMLDEKIVQFGEKWVTFSSHFQHKVNESDIIVSARFPKLHALAHYVNIIRNKGTSDNYETGLGERQHPQSKTDYSHTNHQPGYESQMLRTYREREIIARIQANIQRQEMGRHGSSEQLDSSNLRVELGSPQRRMLTTTYISTLPYPQQPFQQQLQIFLQENVLGRQARRMPSARNLPSIQGTYVVSYRLLRVTYVSLVDSRERVDLIRSNPEWRSTGERHDFIVVKDRDDESVWFAQLQEVFSLKFNNESHRIAYVRRFQTRPQRNKSTGYIELQDRNEYGFIFVDSIMRSCVVLAPEVQASRLVVCDLNDSDMYFRLLDIL